MNQTTKSAFDWSDPFRLDDQLSEDEKMVRDSARAYAEHKLMPRVSISTAKS